MRPNDKVDASIEIHSKHHNSMACIEMQKNNTLFAVAMSEVNNSKTHFLFNLLLCMRQAAREYDLKALFSH